MPSLDSLTKPDNGQHLRWHCSSQISTLSIRSFKPNSFRWTLFIPWNTKPCWNLLRTVVPAQTATVNQMTLHFWFPKNLSEVLALCFFTLTLPPDFKLPETPLALLQVEPEEQTALIQSEPTEAPPRRQTNLEHCKFSSLHNSNLPLEQELINSFPFFQSTSIWTSLERLQQLLPKWFQLFFVS